jgi:hypothetical protein
LISSMILKSCRRKWFHSCVSSGRTIALWCSQRFFRDVHKIRGSSSYMYSIFKSRWIWFLITFKVEKFDMLEGVIIPSVLSSIHLYSPRVDRVTLTSIAKKGN